MLAVSKSRTLLTIPAFLTLLWTVIALNGCGPRPAQKPTISLSDTDSLVLVPISQLTETQLLSNTLVVLPANQLPKQLNLLSSENSPANSTIAFVPASNFDTFDTIPSNALALVQKDTVGIPKEWQSDLVPSQPIVVASADVSYMSFDLKSVKRIEEDASNLQGFVVDTVAKESIRVTLCTNCGGDDPLPTCFCWFCLCDVAPQ